MAKQRRPVSPNRPTHQRPPALYRADSRPVIDGRRRVTPQQPRASRRHSGASTYVEAVALYERGLEALQRHAFRRRADLFESVLRQYPEEKELHERVRLYLNICQRQADAEGSGAADHRRTAVRRDARHQRRAATIRRSPTCGWSATKIPTTITRCTCSPSPTRSAANPPKPSRISSAPSRSTRKIAPSPAAIPISSRSAATTRFERRSTRRRCRAPIAAARSGRAPRDRP